MGRAMEGMLSVFAELDNNMRTERTKQGMLERVKQGIWVWQAPLGYYRPFKGAIITPDPNKSNLIKLIFEEYAKGTHTFKSIAEFSNKRGLETKQGKPMTPQLMEKILKNPIYYGFINIWGGHHGNFEPIISENLFMKCQPDYLKSSHASPRSANNPLFPLRKVISCKECQSPITGSSSTGRHGKKYPYYHHANKKCETVKSIPKETFEQLFVEHLQNITPDAKYEKLFKAIVLDIWKNNHKKIDEENTKIQREITALENERQKVFDFHRTGKYTDEDFEEQRGIISKKIIQKRLLIQDKWKEEFEMEKALEHCFSFVRNTSKAWINADYPTKIRFQKLIFKERIEFDGSKFGTASLSEVYRINQEYCADKSSLVDNKGFEWNSIENLARKWINVFESLNLCQQKPI